MDIIHKLTQYQYTIEELRDMTALLELSMFMEADINRLDEAFGLKDLADTAGKLLSKAGLHLHKGDGLVQQAMKGGTVLAKFVWYALKSATGDKEAIAKVKELANTEIKKEDVLAFLLNLDMATLHVITGPIHTIDAITGWHLWANVKEAAGASVDKASKAIENLIDVAKNALPEIKNKLIHHMKGIISLVGLDKDYKKVDAL
jgi:hypothetical protein